MYQDLISNFNYEEMLAKANRKFDDHAMIVNSNLDYLKREVLYRQKKQYSGFRLKNYTLDEILYDFNLESYRSYVFKIAKTLTQIDNMSSIVESYLCVMDFYDKPIYFQYAKNLEDRLSDYKDQIYPYVQNLLEDIEYVNKFQNSELIKSLKSKKLGWYWTTFPMFNYMKNYRWEY